MEDGRRGGNGGGKGGIETGETGTTGWAAGKLRFKVDQRGVVVGWCWLGGQETACRFGVSSSGLQGSLFAVTGPVVSLLGQDCAALGRRQLSNPPKEITRPVTDDGLQVPGKITVNALWTVASDFVWRVGQGLDALGRGHQSLNRRTLCSTELLACAQTTLDGGWQTEMEPEGI